MLTIKDAYYAEGYTGNDHLLDHSAVRGLIGLEVRTVRDAQEAVAYVEKMNPPDSRVRLAPVRLVIRFADGEERLV